MIDCFLRYSPIFDLIQDSESMERISFNLLQ